MSVTLCHFLRSSSVLSYLCRLKAILPGPFRASNVVSKFLHQIVSVFPIPSPASPENLVLFVILHLRHLFGEIYMFRKEHRGIDTVVLELDHPHSQNLGGSNI